MRDAAQRSFDLSFGSDPLLSDRAASPSAHEVSLLPYLRLIEFGLDPAAVSEEWGPLSAIQLARNFARRDHAHPSAVLPDSLDAQLEAIPSLLSARAVQKPEPMELQEWVRCDLLYAQFMRSLIPAWRVHSKVRSLCSTPLPIV